MIMGTKNIYYGIIDIILSQEQKNPDAHPLKQGRYCHITLNIQFYCYF